MGPDTSERKMTVTELGKGGYSCNERISMAADDLG